MSERELYVACTCFHELRTSEPPIDRALLDLDSYGNVKRIADRTPEDSPEDLWDWRETACEHYGMRLADMLWFKWDGVEYSRALEKQFRKGGMPAVRGLLERRLANPMASIFIDSAGARAALTELEALAVESPVVRVRVLTDLRGRTSAPVARRSPVDRFARIGGQMYLRSPTVGVLELGIQGRDFVVRDHGDPDREVLRSPSMLVERDDYGPMFRIGGAELFRTLYLPAPGLHPHWGWSPRHSFFPSAVIPNRLQPYVPPTMRIEEREISLFELEGVLGELASVLRASVATGNPVVTYYNGCSLGYERPIEDP